MNSLALKLFAPHTTDHFHFIHLWRSYKFFHFPPKQWNSVLSLHRKNSDMNIKNLWIEIMCLRFPLCVTLWDSKTQYCFRSRSVFQSECGKAITKLIASYHYYCRCTIDWLSAGSRQTGTHWVVISFNSSWIAWRCAFWKVSSPCVCVSASGDMKLLCCSRASY